MNLHLFRSQAETHLNGANNHEARNLMDQMWGRLYRNSKSETDKVTRQHNRLVLREQMRSLRILTGFSIDADDLTLYSEDELKLPGNDAHEYLKERKPSVKPHSGRNTEPGTPMKGDDDAS